MPWTPSYQADYTRWMLYQLVAFIQRDQRAALDWVQASNQSPESLPSIVTYQLAPWTIPQYPALLAVPVDSIFDQDAVGSRHGLHTVFIAIAIAHQDPDVCAELVQDYTRALDMIFNSLNFADFYQSWPITLTFTTQTQTRALPPGTLKELFVARHNYDEIRRQKDRFACAASLEVRIDREET